MLLKCITSSSSGNCYILESYEDILLLECGVSFLEIKKALNFNLSNISGMLLSHEHKDHSKSTKEIMESGIDVYMSNPTADTLGLSGHKLKAVEPLKQFEINNFKIMPFDVQHDAVLPLGYLIQEKKTSSRTLFITDSYYCKYKFKGLNYIMIECNYIKETLDENIAAGIIPEAMKARLLRSHFSLENVKEFLKANDLSQCREIILLHLSDSNSNAKRMVREIHELTGIKPKVAEAGLEVALELYPY